MKKCDFTFLSIGIILLIGPSSAGVLEVPDEFKETVREAEMELENVWS